MVFEGARRNRNQKVADEVGDMKLVMEDTEGNDDIVGRVEEQEATANDMVDIVQAVMTRLDRIEEEIKLIPKEDPKEDPEDGRERSNHCGGSGYLAGTCI